MPDIEQEFQEQPLEQKEKPEVVEYTLRLASMKRFSAKMNKVLSRIQALVDREFGQVIEQGAEEYQQELLATTQGNIAEDIAIFYESAKSMGVLPICTITPFGVYFGKLPFGRIKAMVDEEPDKYYIQSSDGSTPSLKTLERLISEKQQ